MLRWKLMRAKESIFFLFLILFLSNVTLLYATVQTPKKGVGAVVGRNEIDTAPPGLQALGISWFFNWALTSPGFEIGRRSCTEFVPLVRYKASEDDRRSEIEPIAKNHRGIYWLIGNEPDSFGSTDSDGGRVKGIPNGDLELIRAYTSYAKTIKTIDPTAKLILGGFASVVEYPEKTPVAYNFARVLKDSLINNGVYPGGQRPEGWHIHLYDCCDLNNFKTDLKAWKEWQNRVLGGETWVTEFGSLGPQPNINIFMKDTVNFMETTNDPNYRVNRYAWYAFNKGPASLYNGAVTPPLSQMGRVYADLPYVGPRPTPVPCDYTPPTPTPEPSITISPTASPSPTPTLQIPLWKGWNALSWLPSYPSTITVANLPAECKFTSQKPPNLWENFIKTYQPENLIFTASNTYFILCQDTATWEL